VFVSTDQLAMIISDVNMMSSSVQTLFPTFSLLIISWVAMWLGH